MTLLSTLNGSDPLYDDVDGHWPEIPERSPCVAGVIPVIYYSVLLSLGLPGEWGARVWDLRLSQNRGPPSSSPDSLKMAKSQRIGETLLQPFCNLCAEWSQGRRQCTLIGKVIGLVQGVLPKSSNLYLAPTTPLL